MKRVKRNEEEIPAGLLQIMNIPDIWKAIAKSCDWPEVVALSRTCRLIRRSLERESSIVLKNVHYKAIYRWKCICKSFHVAKNDEHGTHEKTVWCSKRQNIIWPCDPNSYPVMMYPMTLERPFQEWGAVPLKEIAYIIECHREETEEGVDDPYRWATDLKKALGNAWVRYARSSGIIKCNLLREWKH